MISRPAPLAFSPTSRLAAGKRIETPEMSVVYKAPEASMFFRV